jgi:hypothetical protein
MLYQHGRKLLPWGQLRWLSNKLPDVNWSYCACLGTEQRSVLVPIDVARQLSIAKFKLILIKDEISWRGDEAETDDCIERNFRAFRSEITVPTDLNHFELLCDLELIDQYVDTELRGLRNIILDISSFPKRFYFYLIRRLLLESFVDNLIVVYGAGEAHAEETELIGDFGPILPLPGYPDLSRTKAETSKMDRVVVSAGYTMHGVTELFSRSKNGKIDIVVPFPPGVPNKLKTWEQVMEIDDAPPGQLLEEPERIPAFDCAGMFSYLNEISLGGERTTLLAPYGPKPLSLGMCVFAVEMARNSIEVPVLYAQPQSYNPNYTTGLQTIDGSKQVFGYPLVVDGRNIYAL